MGSWHGDGEERGRNAEKLSRGISHRGELELDEDEEEEENDLDQLTLRLCGIDQSS